MNSCVNNSIDFSPFEIIFGKRPNFPLMQFHGESLKDIPMDMRTYFQELSSKLNTINDIVYENSKASGQQMEEKENMKTNELKLQIGDYVYLQCQPTGAGRNLSRFLKVHLRLITSSVRILSSSEILPEKRN